jgi:hypothetical protein
MVFKSNELRLFSVIIASALGGLTLWGCASPHSPAASTPRSATTSSISEATEEETPAKQETLAAVEEFLTRTQEYRLSPATKPTTTPPPPDASAKVGSDNIKIASPAVVIGTSVSPTGSPSAPPPVPPPLALDAAYANTQVSISESGSGETPIPVPAVESVTIRWKQREAETPAAPARTNASNAPLDMQSPTAATTLERTVPALQQQLETDKDFAAEWRLRMVQLALDRDSDASSVSPNLPDDSRALLTAVVGTAAAARNLIRNPMLTGEEALQQVDGLRQFLSNKADPVVSVIALCRKVVTFGSYEEMASEDFVAGRPIQTIVYSEIRNLKAENGEGGMFDTRLSTRLEALTADGKSVWQREEPEIVDHCRRRRTDFFIAQRITLPPTLPAGEYVLKVLVEDKLSGRIGEASRPFSVFSPVSLAKAPLKGK